RYSVAPMLDRNSGNATKFGGQGIAFHQFLAMCFEIYGGVKPADHCIHKRCNVAALYRCNYSVKAEGRLQPRKQAIAKPVMKGTRDIDTATGREIAFRQHVPGYFERAQWKRGNCLRRLWIATRSGHHFHRLATGKCADFTKNFCLDPQNSVTHDPMDIGVAQ